MRKNDKLGKDATGSILRECENRKQATTNRAFFCGTDAVLRLR